ncbi:antibiotic biosynthesis monooxygenase [Nonomuraea sp. NPDC050783]|uniref:antibiotic biosynthesis monooxygenase family protein n=1 Tax=Nonomuraea sp. NPDC050783 TaxID=3154634 RepID=UPI00346709E3
MLIPRPATVLIRRATVLIGRATVLIGRAAVLRSRWIAGPAPAGPGPLVVALTDYRAHRLLDLPGIARQGLALSRLWPELPGAVGMWLWSDLPGRRAGSLSVWRSEADLRAFVRLPEHVRIMRAYRDRGTLRSRTWEIATLEGADLWSAVHE